MPARYVNAGHGVAPWDCCRSSGTVLQRMYRFFLPPEAPKEAVYNVHRCPPSPGRIRNIDIVPLTRLPVSIYCGT